MNKKVLVVDDEQHIRDVLKLYLKKEGYEVLTAENGREGLEIARNELPALIVSDSMMPVMDGLEFCELVKKDDKLKDIFFIMLTGKTTTSDKIEGLNIGADEYLTKPFDNKEIVARVNAFIRISNLQLELKEANLRLKEMDSVKNDLTHMIVHDMKTPISAIMLSTDILLDPEHLVRMDETQTMFLKNTKSSATELFTMVMNLLDITKMEEGRLELERELFDPREPIMELQQDLSLHIEDKELVFNTVFPSENLYIDADRQIVKRIFMNLLTNAIKHTPTEGYVTVGYEFDGESVRIFVKDTGEGISPEHLSDIFEKFTKVKTKYSRKYDTGLGLPFCRMATEAHGGTVTVQSVIGEGSTFYVTLPLTTKEAD